MKRVGVCMLCACDSAIRLAESDTKAFRLRKKLRWIRKVFATFWPKQTTEKVYFSHKIQYWMLVSLSQACLFVKETDNS